MQSADGEKVRSRYQHIIAYASAFHARSFEGSLQEKGYTRLRVRSNTRATLMFILMIGSTDSPTTAASIINLASACLGKGHELTVFFNAESTRLLEAGRLEGFSDLISQGVRLLACRTSASELGLASVEDLIEGSEMSSLGELVDLMEASDRTLFLG